MTMRFKEAYLQEKGSKRLGIEEELVFRYLKDKGIPVKYYTEKLINRRSLPLTFETLVVGNIPCMQGAMKQLGIDIPNENSYPQSLKKYLFRNVWVSTLEKVERQLRNGYVKPFFAKPKTQQKKFTGRVFETDGDLYFVSGCSKKTELVCCEIVNWISEYRVYVVQSKIVAVSHYDGDKSVKPDFGVIESAIKELETAGEAFAGYGIDFGVLDTGETALIEMNDGFGLGAYDISANDYGQLVEARWAQIVASKSDKSIR